MSEVENENNESNPPLNRACKKKPHFRFKPSFDIDLLKQVEIERPFEKKKERTIPEAWKVIAHVLNDFWGLEKVDATFLPVTGDACQRRCKELLNKFSSD